jgi:metal-responsive CopG/Arc/MetJ family transcriptional regulator
MKTAVSIPDDVFNEAELLARELKTSRSDLYARALAAFVGDHSADRVTQALDEALQRVEAPLDPAVIGAAHRILRNVEW